LLNKKYIRVFIGDGGDGSEHGDSENEFQKVDRDPPHRAVDLLEYVGYEAFYIYYNNTKL